jgi:hypothetical protein
LPDTASPSGQSRLRIKPSQLEYLAYADLKPDLQQAQCNNTTRLQEIIARLGELWLSPELAHVMLFGSHALAFSTELSTTQDFPQAYTETCHDPHAILLAMDEPHPPNATSSAKFLAQFQSTCLPQPKIVILRDPLHLCAWRLDAPPRICLYTGQHPSDPTTLDPATHLPHTLSKVLLEDRTKRPTPARIHLITDDDISPNAVRKSLLHYAQTALTPQREKLSGQAGSALHTTLEEAIACLIHAPLRNHTTIELNQSPPWDKDHIDSR